MRHLSLKLKRVGCLEKLQLNTFYSGINFYFQHVRLLLVLNGGTTMTDPLLKMTR